MTINEFLQRLEGVKGGNGQYTARCPAHDDHRNSLSVSVGSGGKILVKCHAGCSVDDIVDAMGVTTRDLFAELKPEEAFPVKQSSGNRSPVVAAYTYPSGAQKLRRADKSFTWRRPDGKGGWTYNRQGVPHELYIAGKLTTAMMIVEGEKDADNLHRLGYDAASGADGAGPGKWRKEYTEQLRGCAVCIFQDNDAVGKAYAQETASALYGVAKAVQVLDLTEVWPEMPEHGDISDMLTQFGTEQTNALIVQLMGSTPQWKPDPKQAKRGPSLIRACDVPYEPPRWTIAPYIQRGKGTLIQADNGMGKTAFVCAIAAHISTGKPLLDVPVESPGNVLIISVEDDLPVLRGRIEASGGDLTKCHFMANAAGLSFNSGDIEEAIKQLSAKLIIFDPLQAFLGAKVDMFRANETRPELAKLFEMCDRNDCACIIVAHMGKNTGDKSPVNRALGSVDIPAAMRSVLQIIENPDNAAERIAVQVKCSNAPKGRSIVYTIGDRGGVQWLGFSPITADELGSLVKRKEKGIPYEKEPLVQVFNQLITDKPGGGFWSYAELKSEGAKALGFPPFADIADLRMRLDGGLARELQAKDGLIVTHGETGPKNKRGIRIARYSHPQGYQLKFPKS